MKAVVTGASGFVGAFLCEELLAHDHTVTACVRTTSNLRWLEGLEVSIAYADLLDADSLRNAFDRADAVYHVAGLVRADRRRDFMKVNCEGTRNVAEAAFKACGSGRIVFVSSQAAAGPSPGPEGIDEGAEAQPVSAYGESKLEAEKLLEGLEDLEVVIVRPSVVYGPRDSETLSFFQIVAKLGVRPFLHGGVTVLSMIEVHDLVRGIRLAGEAPQAAGKTYFLSAPKPYRLDEVLEEIARAFKKRTFALPVPRIKLSAAAELSQFFSQFSSGPARLSHLKLAELAQRYWVVRTERAQRELGFRADTPLSEGIKAAARWYVQNGWL